MGVLEDIRAAVVEIADPIERRRVIHGLRAAAWRQALTSTPADLPHRRGDIRVAAMDWDGDRLILSGDGGGQAWPITIVNPPLLVVDRTGEIVRDVTSEDGTKVGEQRMSLAPARALRSVLRNTTPPPDIPRGDPTLIAYAELSDRVINNINDNYLLTQAGPATSEGLVTSTTAVVGRWSASSEDFTINQYGVHFDTSAIDRADHAVQSFVVATWFTSVDVDEGAFPENRVEMVASGWDPTFDAADWQNLSQGSPGQVVIARMPLSDVATGQYNDWTSDPGSAAAFSALDAYFQCWNFLAYGVDPPSTGENRGIISAADEAGTSQDPRLTVTYAPKYSLNILTS
jgi:hypothetical protein